MHSIQAIPGLLAGRNHLFTHISALGAPSGLQTSGERTTKPSNSIKSIYTLSPLKEAIQPSAYLSTLETLALFPTGLTGRGMTPPPPFHQLKLSTAQITLFCFKPTSVAKTP